MKHICTLGETSKIMEKLVQKTSQQFPIETKSVKIKKRIKFTMNQGKIKIKYLKKNL